MADSEIPEGVPVVEGAVVDSVAPDAVTEPVTDSTVIAHMEAMEERILAKLDTLTASHEGPHEHHEDDEAPIKPPWTHRKLFGKGDE